MAATPALNIINSFALSGVPTAGGPYVGWQGPYNGLATTALNIANLSATVLSGNALSGLVYEGGGTLATATALKIYDSSVHKPATFNYVWIWADQACYVQTIATATNCVYQMLPTVPQTFSLNTCLGAANTTPISTSAPSTTAIATIYLGNYSGTTMNWSIAVIL